jgi:hypothetical protein
MGGMEKCAQHQFSAIWAFENAISIISLVSNENRAEQQFFKYPYCQKLYTVSGDVNITVKHSRMTKIKKK